MNRHSALWCCAVALVMIAALRLSAAWSGKGLLSLLIFTETGRRPVSTAPTSPATEPDPTENFTFPTQITQPTQREDPPAAVLSFSAHSLEWVKMRYGCDLRPDLGTLLTGSLDWDLKQTEPTVLILHTHGTESFRGDYKAWVPWRTTDPDHNMVRIGREVARVLELGGIRVIRDTTLHDYPDYNSAYSSARKSIRQYLEEYPSIRLVLDLHRDASDDDQNQLTTHATVAGQPASQLMFVVGTDAGGLYHPRWQENLALALKLTVLLEGEDPGVTRGISLRQQRFNGDLTPGSLLVEVGAAGDTLDQALLAANALARAILALADGAAGG
jgi:stage II sporulation protein P